MDVFCLSVGASALCVVTLLWTLTRGHDAWGPLGALGLLWASLCFSASPAVCGGVVLFCVGLICVKRREKLLPGEGRAVLITGCDSGFGHALAEHLAQVGVQVFAGVLDVNGGGAQRLKERGRENLHVLQLDVTDNVQVEEVHRYISAQVGHTGLWGMVNNAGVLHCPADAELLPLAASRRCMEVNFLSAVHLCQVFLPLLRRSRGRIVNMSSMAGVVPMPRFSGYGASKAALGLFSEVLRIEVSVWGVNVSVIQPTGYRTSIFGTSDDIRRYRDELLASVSPEAREDYGEAYISSLPSSLSQISQQSPKDLSPVLDALCHALLSAQPRPLYCPGRMGRLLPLLHRLCPTAVFAAIITAFLRDSQGEPPGPRGTPQSSESRS
ncbi:hypothetical protein INR49_020652 [Caranx melampygus]|nr:hypothetical protein INR49_020652 [Caranx melampygus]